MIGDIRLQNFRSYDDAAFEFAPGVNIVVGPNASGKTNLLEGILTVARGSSYRTADVDLVQAGKPWARLDVHVESALHTVKLQPQERDKKLFEIDGKLYKRFVSQIALPLVLFEPGHLNLLSGSPEERRNYLDGLLEQLEPGYGQVRRNYRRILAQRNALLKQGAARASSQMFAWDVRLAELAGTIVRLRSNLTARIADILPALYGELSRSPHTITVDYTAQFDPANYETKLLHKLEQTLDRDLLRGFTGNGPHREDLRVSYDGQEAALMASRGEARTTVLALKIIELELLATDGASPLLLLDDVFSELDGARRKLLTGHIERYQSFITTTDADIVVQNFTETCNIIALG